MKATMLILAVVLAAMFASSALAGGNSSATATYEKRGTKVQKVVNKPKKAPKPTGHATVTSGGTLPFTGLDLAFIAGGGVLLVGMGVSLRRITRKPPAA
jgi:hypothetical protein